MAEDLRQRYAEALAAEYTRSVPRCDKWGENEWVENPEPADRVEQTVSVIYEASDGHPAIRFPTCMEVAEVVAAVRDDELREWLKRAEKAETAVARARALADRWCHEPHPTHDHSCPDDLRRELLAALDDTAGTENG